MFPVILKPPIAPICGEVVRFSGTITANTTLDPTKTYIIDGDITVVPNATLNILPGTVLKFEHDRGIRVQGKLLANGNSGHSVYFTSWRDDNLCGDTNNDTTASVPAAGDWRWIEFAQESDPSSVLRYAVVRYGGRDALYGQDAWRAPIRIFNVSPTLDYITFEKNYRNAVQIVGGNWLSNAIVGTTTVYWLADLVVLPGNTLTIGPGVKIKVAYDNGVLVKGTLNANGNANQPIIITSEHDDTVCGVGAGGESICDTNDNATASVPAAGDWRWIDFAQESDASSVLRYAVVRYGGRDALYGQDTWRAAIRIISSSPTIERVQFSTNHRAIDYYDSASPLLGCNDIVNGTHSGMYNWNPANVVTAEGHWWGDSSGPQHPANPSGSGQGVNDGIDFTPWADSPCTDFSP